MKRYSLLALILFAAGAAGQDSAKQVTLKKGDRILFYGDSLTAQAMTPKGWITLLREHFKKNHPDVGIEVTTFAVGGYPIVQRLKNLDAEVLAKKPTIVVIQGGVPDALRTFTADEFKSALETMIDRLRKAEVRVVVCSCTSLGEKKDGSNRIDKRLDEFAEIARHVAAAKNVPLNDLRKAFQDYWNKNNPDNKDKGILTYDGNHFNDNGNQFVFEKMLQMFAVPATPKKKAGKSLMDRYPLPYPPKLPDGKTVVTESDASFLKPGPNLRAGVEIARTRPVVDFAFYPEQNYPGNPWSHRSDGIVVGDIYYSSTNDHLAPRGTAHLWEYDGRAKKFRMLCDTTKFLESVKAFPPDMNYRPGEMQSRIDLGSDGWLYYATDRGSPTVTNDANGYRGEWVLRTNPKTLQTEVIATHPIAKHTIPASVLDPKRMIFYGGTAPGKDAANQKIQFFALDVKTRKLLKVADDGPYRTLIFSKLTGKVFWEGKVYDPETNQISVSKVPDVRSATHETPEGIVYGTSGRSADLWAFNVKTGEVKQLGSGAVAKQEYIASLEVDPTGRYLYYVPGAHGGAAADGTPIVQYDLHTGKRKVLAFLHSHFWEKYGYALDGSFGSALDETGERLFISWDGWRRGQPRGWESAALIVVHIPASERPKSER